MFLISCFILLFSLVFVCAEEKSRSKIREMVEVKFNLADRSQVSTAESTSNQYLNFQFYTSDTCEGEPYETQVSLSIEKQYTTY